MMIRNSFIGGIILASQATAAILSPRVASPLNHLKPRICYEGESSKLLCYRSPNGTPQNLDIDDITYVGRYLRNYGITHPDSAFWTMTAADAPDCGEWGVFARGSVLVLAKHIGTDIDSSVLYEDLATAIDGGFNATATQKAKAIIGCLADGGSVGVVANSSRPEYTSDDYISKGYSPRGILIKVVSAG